MSKYHIVGKLMARLIYKIHTDQMVFVGPRKWYFHHPKITHAEPSIRTKCCMVPMCEGDWQNAWMHRLARAFIGQLFDNEMYVTF